MLSTIILVRELKLKSNLICNTAKVLWLIPKGSSFRTYFYFLSVATKTIDLHNKVVSQLIPKSKERVTAICILLWNVFKCEIVLVPHVAWHFLFVTGSTKELTMILPGFKVDLQRSLPIQTFTHEINIQKSSYIKKQCLHFLWIQAPSTQCRSFSAKGTFERVN